MGLFNNMGFNRFYSSFVAVLIAIQVIRCYSYGNGADADGFKSLKMNSDIYGQRLNDKAPRLNTNRANTIKVANYDTGRERKLSFISQSRNTAQQINPSTNQLTSNNKPILNAEPFPYNTERILRLTKFRHRHHRSSRRQPHVSKHRRMQDRDDDAVEFEPPEIPKIKIPEIPEIPMGLPRLPAIPTMVVVKPLFAPQYNSPSIRMNLGENPLGYDNWLKMKGDDKEVNKDRKAKAVKMEDIFQVASPAYLPPFRRLLVEDVEEVKEEFDGSIEVI